MSNEAVVVDVLTEKIKRQEAQIKHLVQELQEARKASVGHMLGELRLREAVLLYVGTDAVSFDKRFRDDFGIELQTTALRHLFVLDNAPVSDSVREEFRAAFNRGMNLW